MIFQPNQLNCSAGGPVLIFKLVNTFHHIVVYQSGFGKVQCHIHTQRNGFQPALYAKEIGENSCLFHFQNVVFPTK